MQRNAYKKGGLRRFYGWHKKRCLLEMRRKSAHSFLAFKKIRRPFPWPFNGSAKSEFVLR
jgi:hypothetical protein